MLLLRATLVPATLVPGWLPASGIQRLIWTIRITIVLGTFLLISCAVDKPLWSWLEILIVPAALAVGGYLFTRSENRRTQQIANQRANDDREIAAQRSQDDALQTYLK